MPNKLIYNNLANQLLTQVYGSDGRNIHPIKTDGNGRLEVTGDFFAVVNTKTVELKSNIINSTGQGVALTAETASLNMYSFYVYNQGTSPFKVKLQVSPVSNNEYFIDDSSEQVIISPGVGPKAILIPKHYFKYTRLCYEAISGRINAEIWFNGRG